MNGIEGPRWPRTIVMTFTSQKHSLSVTLEFRHTCVIRLSKFVTIVDALKVVMKTVITGQLTGHISVDIDGM